MKTIVGLLCGLIFGAGLAASGMTSTDKVLGFLDVAGAWQPDLAFVMASALCVSLPGYIYFTKKGKTVFNTELFLPTNKSIDWRLLLGAAVFGIGWGVWFLGCLWVASFLSGLQKKYKTSPRKKSSRACFN